MASHWAVLLLVLTSAWLQVLSQEQEERSTETTASGGRNPPIIALASSGVFICMFLPLCWFAVKHPAVIRNYFCFCYIPRLSDIAGTEPGHPPHHKVDKLISEQFARELREEVCKLKQDTERQEVQKVQGEVARLRQAAEAADGGRVHDEENPEIPGQAADLESEPDVSSPTTGPKKRLLGLAIDTSTGFSRGCSPEEEQESLAFFGQSESPKKKASPRKGKSKSPAHSASNSPRPSAISSPRRSDEIPSPKRKAKTSPRRAKSHSPRVAENASPWGNSAEGSGSSTEVPSAQAATPEGHSRAESTEPHSGNKVREVEERRPSLSDQGLAELSRLCADLSQQRKPTSLMMERRSSSSPMSFQDLVTGIDKKSQKKQDSDSNKDDLPLKEKTANGDSWSPSVSPGGRKLSTSPAPNRRRPSTSEISLASPGGHRPSTVAYVEVSPGGTMPSLDAVSPGGRRPSTSAATSNSPLARGRSTSPSMSQHSPPTSRRPSINAPQPNPDPIEERRPSVSLQRPPSRLNPAKTPAPNGPPMNPPFEGQTVLWQGQVMQSDGAQRFDKYSLIFKPGANGCSIVGTRQTGAIEGVFNPVTHEAVWREKHPSDIVDVSARVEKLKDGAAFCIVGEYQTATGIKGSLILSAERN